MSLEDINVSIIIPIYNGEKWIDRCFAAILNQTARVSLKLQLCICDDASSDNTHKILEKWKLVFEDQNIDFKIHRNSNSNPRGVGYAKNQAVKISTGSYLCFQDIDDVMMPDRILEQFKQVSKMPPNVIAGSQFVRDPPDSTKRFTVWANNLSEEQLNYQVYTSNGPTVIMPTWFCHRNVFYSVGGFDETGKGCPEDLIFFYRHLDLGGTIARIDKCLLIYQYHPQATTLSITEETIWNLRITRLQEKVLSKWESFTIWNAGKQGRKFYKSLTKENKQKVAAFCDVDNKKIAQGYYEYFNELNRRTEGKIKIIHFTNAHPPFIICMKQDLTQGNFESNLESLNLKENQHYIYFS